MAGLHIVGVLIHTVKYRDPIGLSMVTGMKNCGPNAIEIKNKHPFIGLAFIAITIAVFISFYLNFDIEKQTIRILGTSYQLGEEVESEEKDD